MGDDLFDDLVDQFARIFGGEDFIAIAVDDFALIVHHIIEIEDVLPAPIVELFHAFLRGLHRAVEPAVLKCFAVLHTESLHHGCHAFCGREVAHEVVLEGDKELGISGVSLPRATSAELAVDPAGFVAFGADHHQASHIGDSLPEFDVGTSTCHVGGNRHGSPLSGSSDDLGFLAVILCVEDGVGDLGPLQHAGEGFGGVH